MAQDLPSFQPDEESIAQLSSVVSCDRDQARFLLEATHGNVDMALQMIMGNEQAAARGLPTAASAAIQIPPRPRAPPAQAYNGNRGNNVPIAALAAVMRVPIWLLKISFGVFKNTVYVGFSVAGYVGDRVLPQPAMQTIRGVIAGVVGRAPELDSTQQATRFATEFRKEYGETHPHWLEDSWSHAAATAQRQYKFLMVYLHSPEHQDTDKFCRGVLCAPHVVEYVNQQFVAWGGDVRHSDAYSLSSRLGATSYPYLALLLTTGGRSKLVARVAGFTTADDVLSAFAQAVDEAGVLMAAERADREERAVSRQLVESQDREYEEALAADRERQQRKEEEARRLAEAEAAKAAEELRLRQLREEEERRVFEARAAIDARREAKRASLPPEEPNHPESSALRIRLPDGSHAQRSFLKSHTVAHVYDFVDSLESTTFAKYSLVKSFPRQVYGPEFMGMTLAEAGLAHQEALFVIREDD